MSPSRGMAAGALGADKGMGSVSKYLLPLAFGLAAALTGVAQAQDYSAGKTPAQLFASDCSACHKTPQGLAKGTDARSLANFLREHYTTKRELAGALAAFVAGAGAGTPAAADGKPKPGAAREKPEPAAASGKPRRPEPAGEGEQAARPAPKPRSAAVGSEPKPGEEQKPAQRRQPATPRTVHPGDGAKPEVDDGAKPAASAEPKPGTRTRAAKPPVTAKRDGEKPAQAARPDTKLESYISSGESAKPIESEAAVDFGPTTAFLRDIRRWRWCDHGRAREACRITGRCAPELRAAGRAGSDGRGEACDGGCGGVQAGRSRRCCAEEPTAARGCSGRGRHRAPVARRRNPDVEIKPGGMAARLYVLAHVPAKWTPVRRQGYAPLQEN